MGLFRDSTLCDSLLSVVCCYALNMTHTFGCTLLWEKSSTAYVLQDSIYWLVTVYLRHLTSDQKILVGSWRGHCVKYEKWYLSIRFEIFYLCGIYTMIPIFLSYMHPKWNPQLYKFSARSIDICRGKEFLNLRIRRWFITCYQMWPSENKHAQSEFPSPYFTLFLALMHLSTTRSQQ